ncbi:hypothetical protein GCM10025864_25060 [Luteimicrobium album]|uniref:Uncharacterized protein n=1 Tax=Luteimicrobium album TaxID=1054550 RepID=A0ABQ6I299_9MICO|nr:hypothetical protein [Luteimicrobium album]GMA24747.1 hypothetical protein GCM10025864_25060 [Luteimicrobium album]
MSLAQHPEALLTPYYGNSRGGRPASDPIGTLTTHDRFALVHRHNSGGAEMTTPVFEELRTLTAGGTQSLLQHPRPEVTPAGLERAERMVPEVLYRMLRPHEVAKGMAFPDTCDWDVPYSKGKRKGKAPSAQDKVKAADNAVTPPATRDIVGAVVQAITGKAVLS